MGLGAGYLFAGGLLGSAGAVRELADNAIKQRDAVAAEQRAEAAWRQRMLAQAQEKIAVADAMLGIEQRGRQATADAINRRLGENADAALAGRYADPVMGDTPLSPEQQSALEQGLAIRDAGMARDRTGFMQDSRNRLVAAVDVGAAEPISLAELDAKDEAAASRAASEAARLSATTDLALTRIDAAQAKADAAAKEREQGKPPPGYRHTAEGNLEAIPGGPADLKQQGQFNADTATMNASFASFDRLAGAANELMNHPGLGGITGLRGNPVPLMGALAVPAAANLGARAMTSQTLVNMAATPTTIAPGAAGAALGAASRVGDVGVTPPAAEWWLDAPLLDQPAIQPGDLDPDPNPVDTRGQMEMLAQAQTVDDAIAAMQHPAEPVKTDRQRLAEQRDAAVAAKQERRARERARLEAIRIRAEEQRQQAIAEQLARRARINAELRRARGLS